MMSLGHAILGISLAFLLILSLPEMIESQIKTYPDQKLLINDISSSFFFFVTDGLGQVLAPPFAVIVT